MTTILIADDHADIRRLVTLTLEFEDFALLEARNGQEALDQVSRHRPALVLLDVMMPGKFNGLEVCRLIRGDPETARTRVLLLSACGEPRDLDAGREAGADSYLVKPFSPLQLLERVKQLVMRSGDPRAC